MNHKNRSLTHVVDRMAVEITELRNRIENIELSGSKRAITLSGYRIYSKRKYEVLSELEAFFADFLGLSVNIETSIQWEITTQN